MRIVYCTDEKYVKYTKKSIESVKKFNPSAQITIVSLTPIQIDNYENFVIPLDREFRKRCENDRITKTAYLKCYLTQLPYSKIIYMDGDVLCQKSLDELWNIPCKYINLCESHSYGKVQAQALGLHKYGLSGMMVMNLDNLREIDFTNKCLEIEKIPEPSVGWQHDETMINLSMKGKLNFIDKKFNYCVNRGYDNPIPYSEAHLLHFIGNQKDKMFQKQEALIIGRSPFVNKVDWSKVNFDRFFVICVNYPVPGIPVDVVIARDYWVEPKLAPATEFVSPNTGWNFCDFPSDSMDLGFKCYTSTSAVYFAMKRGFKSAYLIGIDHEENNKPFEHYDGVINQNVASENSNKKAKEFICSLQNRMAIYQTNKRVSKDWDLPHKDIKCLYG